MKKILSIILGVALMVSLLSFGSGTGAAAITVDVPIYVSFNNATGIDLNIRLNPHLVTTAELIKTDAIPSTASCAYHQEGRKLKVAIANPTAFSNGGQLFILRLTLSSRAGADDELCKLLQVKLNEVITWQADNCILLSGVANGKTYNSDVTINFNEGSATLNGRPFAGGTTVSENGSYVLSVTDLNGKIRTVSFAISKASPSKLGDVNGDTVVNSDDAVAILRHLAGYEVDGNIALGDYNKDGVTNSDDAVAILRMLAGYVD